MDAPTGWTCRRGGRTGERPRPSSRRALSFAAEETSTARRCVHAACSLYVNNWIQSMNHLRPPSGFVFVLCFVSEGVGREKQETLRGSALNTNAAAGFANTGVIHSAPEVTAGSGPPGAAQRAGGGGTGRGQGGAHTCAFSWEEPLISPLGSLAFFSPPARYTRGEIL